MFALGNLVGDGDPFRGGLALKACIAEVRMWSGVQHPSLLHSKLEVGKRSAMEALALNTSAPCQSLVQALCSRDGDLRAAAENSAVFVAALKPNTASVAKRLVEDCNVEIDMTVLTALLQKDPSKPKQQPLLMKLVLSDKCDDLVDALCERHAAVKASVESREMLKAALTPKTIQVAFKLLDKRGVEITTDVSNHVASQPALLESLIFACKSSSTEKIPLIEVLCGQSKEIMAAVASADMISRFVTTERASIALELLSNRDIAIRYQKEQNLRDELCELLIAKNEKGTCKLLKLLEGVRFRSVKEESGPESKVLVGSSVTVQSPNDPEVLARKLCDENSNIRAAAVSIKMFAALARPSTAGPALWLIEEMGLQMDSALMESLLTGTTTEYRLNKKRMTWQQHEE